MIVDERMRTYINSLDMGNTPFLEELEQYAIRERVPIIRREMQSFIKMFLAVNRPKRILEVGTAIGFSTLLMCEYGPEDLEIVTIENYEKRIPIAKENFRRAGREAQITLLEGDAGQILKELEDSFDMIFLFCILVFIVEAFSFFTPLILVLRILSSTLLTFILILALENLNWKKK